MIGISVGVILVYVVCVSVVGFDWVVVELLVDDEFEIRLDLLVEVVVLIWWVELDYVVMYCDLCCKGVML